ncbi:MAG: hypothetical protein WAK86_18880 [Pseudonocardiaceae bacterium]
MARCSLQNYANREKTKPYRVRMVLAADSSTASVAGAWISAAGLVAVIVLGVLNLRQARRGPAGSPSWTLEREWERGPYLLRNTGNADACEVWVEAEDATLVGETKWPVIHKSAAKRLELTTSMNSTRPRIRVHFAGPDKKPGEWGWGDLPV